MKADLGLREAWTVQRLVPAWIDGVIHQTLFFVALLSKKADAETVV